MSTCLSLALLLASCASIVDVQAITPQKSISHNLETVAWPSERLLIGVGEIHGTNEAADLVAALTSGLIANGYKVSVLMEMPQDAVSALSAERPEQAVRDSPWWSRSQQDGREGLANACLVWSLHRRYPQLRLIGVEDEAARDRETGMAASLVASLEAEPGRHAGIFLAGNLHVLETPDGSENALSMAALKLPDRTVVRVDMMARGGAYNACSETCSLREVRPDPRLPLGLSATGQDWFYGFARFTPQTRALDALNGNDLMGLCLAPDNDQGGG